MDVTLLGSGDALGVPAPLCDCEYCKESDRRRRPSVLVEDGDTTLVLDVGPDICEQLHEAGVYDVDAFFATHAHYDHYWGVHELAHATKRDHLHNDSTFDHSTHGDRVTVCGSRAVRTFTLDAFPDVLEHLHYHPVNAGERLQIGDLTVESFPLEHGDKKFPTQGYAVSKNGTTVGYAPDVDGMETVPDPCADLDLLFFDGTVLAADLEGTTCRQRDALDRVDADQVVLTHVSEHLLERHTTDLSGTEDYEVWCDFDSRAM